MLGEILVLAQALTWAIMNVVDANIVKKHVKYIYSFIPVSGIANILIALPFLFFFWNPNKTGLFFAITAGILFGAQAIIYYVVMEKEDASHIIGIIYMYPLFGLIIGSFFLNETLHWINYIGCAITLIGVFMTINRTKGKLKVLLPLTCVALLVATQEALQSVASSHINFFFASATQTFFMGLVLLCALLWKKHRSELHIEIKNLKYAFLSEGLTLLAVLFLVSSYLFLPYVTVSFISVSQILFVVLVEKIWSFVNPNIMQDKQTTKKALALLIVAIGVILVMV